MRRSAVAIVLLSLVIFMVFCDAGAGEAPEDTLFTYDFFRSGFRSTVHRGCSDPLSSRWPSDATPGDICVRGKIH